MLNRRMYFLLISLGLIVASCQKEPDFDDNENNGCKLVRMVQGTHDGALNSEDSVFTFSYDNAGRLSEVTYAFEGFPYPDDPTRYSLHYDAQNRLIKIKAEDLIDQFDVYFTYNTNGKLATIEYMDGDDSAKTVLEYKNGPDQPTAALFYEKNPTWDLQYKEAYTFTNGNVTRVETTGSNYVLVETYEHETSLPNKTGVLPLVDYWSVPLGYLGIPFYFNKNMIKKYTNDTYPFDFTVTYEKDQENIVKMRYHHESGSVSTRNYKFDCK